nr:type II secretion system F family protein [Methylomarinum sp. Ch1-1]MDP4523210.1 type II secretion system F family protein [Methylomarinum sp. Ch1-1]
MSQSFEVRFAKFQFGITQRIGMYRKIMAFAKQGVPLFNTLELFERSYLENKKGDPRAVILGQWISEIATGSNFSQALVGYAPEAEIMLIESGEVSGDMESGLDQAIFVTESIKRIRSAIIGGLAYSLVVLLLLLGMIGMFAFNVVPQLVDVVPPEKWTGASATLYSMSMFVKDYGIYSIFAVIASIIVALKSMPVWVGNSREFADYLPPGLSIKLFRDQFS